MRYSLLVYTTPSTSSTHVSAPAAHPPPLPRRRLRKTNKPTAVTPPEVSPVNVEALLTYCSAGSVSLVWPRAIGWRGSPPSLDTPTDENTGKKKHSELSPHPSCAKPRP